MFTVLGVQATIEKLEGEVASLTAQLASPSGPQQAEHQPSASAGTSYPGGAYGSRPMVGLASQSLRAVMHGMQRSASWFAVARLVCT